MDEDDIRRRQVGIIRIRETPKGIFGKDSGTRGPKWTGVKILTANRSFLSARTLTVIKQRIVILSDFGLEIVILFYLCFIFSIILEI